MKNSLNEGQAVLVGRDGQEIEGECGRRLAGEIDEVGGVGHAEGRGEGGGYKIEGDGWGGPTPERFEGRGGEGW